MAWARMIAGRDGVAERGQRDPAAAARDPGAERTAEHRAPDAQTALPDLDRAGPAGATGPEVQLVVGDDVVEPAADNPERDRPQRDIGDGAGLPAARDPAPVAEPHRDDDAERR